MFLFEIPAQYQPAGAQALSSRQDWKFGRPDTNSYGWYHGVLLLRGATTLCMRLPCAVYCTAGVGIRVQLDGQARWCSSQEDHDVMSEAVLARVVVM